MGYRVDWTLTTPPSFSKKAKPQADPEAKKALEQLEALGYEVALKLVQPGTGVSLDLEWTDRGFKLEGFHWYRDRQSADTYYHGELSFPAEEYFCKISKHYPGLFILDGVGEDGDVFRYYIEDGKRYCVSPVFPEYDPEQLQPKN